jgi:hypothetical protein
MQQLVSSTFAPASPSTPACLQHSDRLSTGCQTLRVWSSGSLGEPETAHFADSSIASRHLHFVNDLALKSKPLSCSFIFAASLPC